MTGSCSSRVKSKKGRLQSGDVDVDNFTQGPIPNTSDIQSAVIVAECQRYQESSKKVLKEE